MPIERKLINRKYLNERKFYKVTQNKYFYDNLNQSRIDAFIKLIKKYEQYKNYSKFEEYNLHPKLIEYFYECIINEKKFDIEKLKRIEKSLDSK